MLKRLQSTPPQKNKNTNVMDEQNFYPMIELNCIFQEAVEWPFPQVALKKIFFSYQPTSAALHHII